MDKQPKISPKRIRAKKVAAMASMGVPYRVIGDEIGSEAKSKRQTVYNLIQTPAVQEELRAIETDLRGKYTAEDCIAELEEARTMAKRKDQPLAVVQAALGKAKVAGLLIDQVKDVTEPVSKDLLDKRAKDSLSQLQVSAEGIEAQTEAVEANTK